MATIDEEQLMVAIEYDGEVITSDYEVIESTLITQESEDESIPYIDPEHLISEVQARRVLWDLDNRDSRDKNKRVEAWKEVSAALFGGYEEFSEAKKRMIERKVRKKWKSVKDAYIRSLRTEAGKGENSASKRRRYIYHHQMCFMQSMLENRLGIENMEFNPDAENDEEQQMESEESLPLIQKLNEKCKKEYLETELIKILKDSKQNRSSPTSSATDRDADKMFLLSLLPKIKRLTPNAAIDFQIQVMQLLQTFMSDSKKRKKFT